MIDGGEGLGVRCSCCSDGAIPSPSHATSPLPRGGGAVATRRNGFFFVIRHFMIYVCDELLLIIYVCDELLLIICMHLCKMRMCFGALYYSQLLE